MSDGIKMGASSTFDRLMTSMSKQKGGASSSTRLQQLLTSSSLGLTPPFGATGDISDMFAGVMNGLDELRRDMTKRIDQVDERAHQGRENLRDELTHVNWEIGDHAKNAMKLLTWEALHIRKLRPGLNTRVEFRSRELTRRL